MTTTTPGIWLTDPTAYRKKLSGFLASRDPMVVLAETPDVIDEIVGTHSAEVLRSRPYDGKWAPNEIIGHLLDTELVYGYRARLILSEDEPVLLGIDQERWVAGQRHNDCDPTVLAREFRMMREANLRFWHGVKPSDLERFGKHNERGNESLAMIREMTAGHDLWHIDQINRYVAAVTARSSGA